MNKEEEKYYPTYRYQRFVSEEFGFDGFQIELDKNHGVLTRGDVISISMLLKMYDDLYKLVHDSENKQ